MYKEISASQLFVENHSFCQISTIFSAVAPPDTFALAPSASKTTRDIIDISKIDLNTSETHLAKGGGRRRFILFSHYVATWASNGARISCKVSMCHIVSQFLDVFGAQFQQKRLRNRRCDCPAQAQTFAQCHQLWNTVWNRETKSGTSICVWNHLPSSVKHCMRIHDSRETSCVYVSVCVVHFGLCLCLSSVCVPAVRWGVFRCLVPSLQLHSLSAIFLREVFECTWIQTEKLGNEMSTNKTKTTNRVNPYQPISNPCHKPISTPRMTRRQWPA